MKLSRDMKQTLGLALIVGLIVFAMPCADLRADAVIEASEKVDEFDRMVVLSYTGEKVFLPDTTQVDAFATWPVGKINEQRFSVHFSRATHSPHWIKSHEVKLLADGELVNFLNSDFDCDIKNDGLVPEVVSFAVDAENARRILMAHVVRIRIGPDEWTWEPIHKAPLLAVYTLWKKKGGGVVYANEQERLAALEKARLAEMIPAAQAAMQGKTLAEIEGTHGKALHSDAATGWAVWKLFKARFQNGRVVEVATP